MLNFLEQERSAGETRLAKTATATLTAKELGQYRFIIAGHATVAIALTLPPASAAFKGMVRYIGNGNAAAVTVVVAAGFGGGHDTITLAQGDGAIVFCDGTYWYNVNIATAT